MDLAASAQVRALAAKETQAAVLRAARRKRAAETASDIARDTQHPRTLLSVLELVWGTDQENSAKKNASLPSILLPNGRTLAGSFHGSWEDLERHLADLVQRLSRMLPPPTRPISHGWPLALPRLDVDEILEKAGYGPESAAALWKPTHAPRGKLAWVSSLKAAIEARLENLHVANPNDEAAARKKLLERAEAMFALLDHSARLESLPLDTWTLPHPRDAASCTLRETRAAKPEKDVYESLVLDGDELDNVRDVWTRRARANVQVRAFRQIAAIPDLDRVQLPSESGAVTFRPGQHFVHIGFTENLGAAPWVDVVQVQVGDALDVELEDCVAEGFVLRVRRELSAPVLVYWRALHERWRAGRADLGLSAAKLINAGILVDYPLKPDCLDHCLEANVAANHPDAAAVENLVANAGLQEMRPYEPPGFPASRVRLAPHNYYAAIVLDASSTMLCEDSWPRAKFMVRRFLGDHGQRIFGKGGRLVLVSGDAVKEVVDFADRDQVEEAQRWVAALCTTTSPTPLENVIGALSQRSPAPHAVHVLTNQASFRSHDLAERMRIPVHAVSTDPASSTTMFLDLCDATATAENLEEVERAWRSAVDAYDDAYRREEEDIRQANRARLEAAKAVLADRRRLCAEATAVARSRRAHELTNQAKWRWINLARLYEKQRALASLNEFLAAASVKVILKEREARDAASDILVHVLERAFASVTKTAWTAATSASTQEAETRLGALQRVALRKNALMRDLMTRHFKRNAPRGIAVPEAGVVDAFMPLWSAAMRAEQWPEDVEVMRRAREQNLGLIEASHEFMVRHAAKQADQRRAEHEGRFRRGLQDFSQNLLGAEVDRALADHGATRIALRGWGLHLCKWRLGLDDFRERAETLRARLKLLDLLDQVQRELLDGERRAEDPEGPETAADLARSEVVVKAVPEDAVNQELLRILRARSGLGACAKSRREFGCFSRAACAFASGMRLVAKASASGALATLPFEAENAARKRARAVLKKQNAARARVAYRAWRRELARELEDEFAREAVAATESLNKTLQTLEKLAQAAARELKLVKAFSDELTRARRRLQHTSAAKGPTLTVLRRAIEGAFQCIPSL